jgi:DNA-binding NarL/FixJ family response regulator
MAPDDPLDNVRETLHRYRPDVVIADYDQGLLLGTLCPRVLVVTAVDSEVEIRAALRAGVRGYLFLEGCAAQLIEAVREVARGSHFLGRDVAPRVASSLGHAELTLRETEVLRLLADGLANKQIAARLDIGVETVKCHVGSILDKLNVATRTQAAVAARRRGLVSEARRAAFGPRVSLGILEFNP